MRAPIARKKSPPTVVHVSAVQRSRGCGIRPSTSRKPRIGGAPFSNSPLTAPVVATPGIARRRASTRSANPTRRAGGVAAGKVTFIVTTRSGRKPRSAASSAAAVRSRSPAPTSSTSASANWPATSARDAPCDCAVARDMPRSDSAASCPEARHAGTSAMTTVDANAPANAKSNTRPSIDACSSLGRSRGPATLRRRTISAARAPPIADAAARSTAASANAWRASCNRLAPSAARTASSRARSLPRASIRFTTLPHAISHTTITDANSSCSARRAPGVTPASSGATDTPLSIRTIVLASVRAASAETSGLSRPTRFQRW